MLNAERLTLNAERLTLKAERLTLNTERLTLNAERLTLNTERLTQILVKRCISVRPLAFSVRQVSFPKNKPEQSYRQISP
jgi:hypothetical protein